MNSQDSLSMTEQDLTLLKTLVALAWADGSLAEGELEWINKVMDQLEVPAQERKQMLEGAPPLPTQQELNQALPENEDREMFMRFLFTVSLEDGEANADEFKLLKDLGQKLGVTGEALEEIRQSVLAT